MVYNESSHLPQKFDCGINHLLFNLLLAIPLIGGEMEISGLSNLTLSASSQIAAKHAGSVSLLLFCPVPVTKNREESLISQYWIQGSFMANRTATLYLRITTSDGRKSYGTPVFQSKGRLKAQYHPARNNQSFDWCVIGEKENRERGPGREPGTAETNCAKLKCLSK
jgi:hypothetical protein